MGPFSRRGGGDRSSKTQPSAASPRLHRRPGVWRLRRAEAQRKPSGVRVEQPAPSCDLSPRACLCSMERKSVGNHQLSWVRRKRLGVQRAVLPPLASPPIPALRPTVHRGPEPSAGNPPRSRLQRPRGPFLSGICFRADRTLMNVLWDLGSRNLGEDEREEPWRSSGSRYPGSRVFRRSTSCSTSTHR